MRVTAEKAVDLLPVRHANYRVFKIVQQEKRPLPLLADRLGQRKTLDFSFYADMRAGLVGRVCIEHIKRPVIYPVAKSGERTTDNFAIKLVAVQYENFTAIGGFMDSLILDNHADAF